MWVSKRGYYSCIVSLDGGHAGDGYIAADINTNWFTIKLTKISSPRPGSKKYHSN